MSRSSGKVVWPWNLVLVILSPSPLSVSLGIVVSVGLWFATPLGVDLVSAPCSAWPGGNRRQGGADEPRHRARREGVGGCDYLRLVVSSVRLRRLRIVIFVVRRSFRLCLCLSVSINVVLSDFCLRLSVLIASVCRVCVCLCVCACPAFLVLRTCHEMNSESCPNLSKSVKLNGSSESWLVYCNLSLWSLQCSKLSKSSGKSFGLGIWS